MASLDEVIEKTLEIAFSSIRACIPAVVQDVNAGQGLVDVQPAMGEEIDGDPVLAPVLASVPVVMLGAGNHALTMALEVGDEGLLLIPDVDISRFLDNGEPAVPPTARRHNLSDAVFLPVRLSDVVREGLPDAGLRLTAENTIIDITGGGVAVTGDIGITGNLDVDGAISATGDISAGGDMTTTAGDIVAGTISLKNHIHTDSTGNPTTPPLV